MISHALARFVSLGPLWFVFVLAVYAWYGSLLFTSIDRVIDGHWVMVDFRDGIYHAVSAARAGVIPWDAEAYTSRYLVGVPGYAPYSPLILLLHYPLAYLDFTTAVYVYSLVVAMVSLGTASILLNIAGLRVAVTTVTALAAALLATRAGYTTILHGQTTFQLVIGGILALHYGRDRPGLAAIGLMLATLKPTWCVPLALLMLARGHLRAVVGGTVLGTLGAVAGAWLVRPSPAGVFEVARALAHAPRVSETLPEATAQAGWGRIDLTSGLARVFGFDPGLSGSVLIAALVLVPTALLLFRARALEDEQDGTGPAASLACAAVLLSVYHQFYDILLLALPLICLASSSNQAWTSLGVRGHAVFYRVGAVAGLNYVSTWAVMRNYEPGSAAWKVLVSINTVLVLGVYVLSLQSAPRSVRQFSTVTLGSFAC